MSVSEQITRLQGLRDRLRTKLNGIGLAEPSADLEACTAAVEGITDNGAVSKKLDTTTSSYTVPAGYHNGSGTVKLTDDIETALAAI